jgi:glycolate oxidase
VTDVESLLLDVVGPGHVLPFGPALADYGHAEALGMRPGEPALVVRLGSTAEVAEVLRVAGEHGLAVTARGSGTGCPAPPFPGPAAWCSRSSG